MRVLWIIIVILFVNLVHGEEEQFSINLTLPKIIRHKEMLQIDVLVQNKIESKDELFVKLTVFDEDDKKLFKFYDSECSKVPSSSTTKSQSFIIPNGQKKTVSFFIQADENLTKFEKIMKINFHAQASTINGEVFRDEAVKILKIEPIGVRTYKVESKTYNLDPSNAVIVETIQGQATNDKYPKFSIKIQGEFLTDDFDNVELGYEMKPFYSFEQRIMYLKGNVEHFRYLKHKNKNHPKTQFSSYYERTLKYDTNTMFYSEYYLKHNSAGLKAYFMEEVASAIEIGELSNYHEMIEIMLDILKSLQNKNGSFRDFGASPPNRSTYFQTAYAAIAFLKIQKYITKSYNDVIDKCFSYLKGIHAVSELDKEAYSVAAIAYILNGDSIQAQKLLDEVEKDVIKIDKNRKCYKIARNETSCNLRHTSFVAIAYLTLNKLEDVKPLMSYIVDEYKKTSRFYRYYSYSVPTSTEAISKFLIARPSLLPTDFTVTLTNEFDFNKTVHITKNNQEESVEVDFPDYCMEPKISIKGSGFCKITKIVENSIEVGQMSSKFNLDIKALAKSKPNERIVRVCAKHNGRPQTLTNVVYDVEIPNGYAYSHIIDLANKTEIWDVIPRRSNSLVQVYLTDFKYNVNYCIDVQVQKIRDDNNLSDASVTVYNYNNKQNLAIGYYNFIGKC